MRIAQSTRLRLRRTENTSIASCYGRSPLGLWRTPSSEKCCARLPHSSFLKRALTTDVTSVATLQRLRERQRVVVLHRVLLQGLHRSFIFCCHAATSEPTWSSVSRFLSFTASHLGLFLQLRLSFLWSQCRGRSRPSSPILFPPVRR